MQGTNDKINHEVCYYVLFLKVSQNSRGTCVVVITLSFICELIPGKIFWVKKAKKVVCQILSTTHVTKLKGSGLGEIHVQVHRSTIPGKDPVNECGWHTLFLCGAVSLRTCRYISIRTSAGGRQR